MSRLFIAILLAFSLFIGGCASLKLEPADFSWATEEILDVDNTGMISAARYSVAFNVKPMITKEFAETPAAASDVKMVRVIRDKAGLYYITGPKFKNVYIFGPAEGGLSMVNAIPVSQTAMDDPKFNFNTRTNAYELWNGKDKYTVTKAAISPLQGGAK